MDKEKQKWLRLDGDDGWQIVIPDTDIKPHSTEVPDKTNELELAWFDCPCKPKIAWEEKIIVHNSFEDMNRVEEAISAPIIKSNR